MQLLICRNVEYDEGPRDWQNTFAEVSLYRGSLPYILLLLGRRISFVIPRTSLYSETCIKRTPLGNAVVSA